MYPTIVHKLEYFPWSVRIRSENPTQSRLLVSIKFQTKFHQFWNIDSGVNRFRKYLSYQAASCSLTCLVYLVDFEYSKFMWNIRHMFLVLSLKFFQYSTCSANSFEIAGIYRNINCTLQRIQMEESAHTWKEVDTKLKKSTNIFY